MVVSKKPTVKKTIKKTPVKHNASVVTATGVAASDIDVPKGIFDVLANKQLLAQAYRVYRANDRQGTSFVKTRGDVVASTRKIYKQKGTGRARHGSISAPIFVGGGNAFGPKPRDYSRSLSQKMRAKSLSMALSHYKAQSQLTFVTHLSKIGPKTKALITLLEKLSLTNTPVLLIPAVYTDTIERAAANIGHCTVSRAQDVTARDIMDVKHVLFDTDALVAIEKRCLVTTK